MKTLLALLLVCAPVVRVPEEVTPEFVKGGWVLEWGGTVYYYTFRADGTHEYFGDQSPHLRHGTYAVIDGNVILAEGDSYYVLECVRAGGVLSGCWRNPRWRATTAFKLYPVCREK